MVGHRRKVVRSLHAEFGEQRGVTIALPVVAAPQGIQNAAKLAGGDGKVLIDNNLLAVSRVGQFAARGGQSTLDHLLLILAAGGQSPAKLIE